ncbi:hydrogen peroxide-inducible genes activator [Sedimentitalea todarodis]|uniref:LysR substrate-binding domain-containing protein n=1 Tax=Sedimentitalea todarodis TaxID=1631240 RepID=A0ABU3VBH6_9RHOB|nr:LysR substrate-binding domain-containing protein [Sedimentitalea todarodis]MDU9003532.1 LysR substrate-binding domain-containing protein [Sedimentitalea todarodis]
MKNVTLKQLRYFEALALHRHFGRAAASCSITQPALSVQIKELENELGAVLFERAARQVRLTTLGEAFLSRVQEVLRAVEGLGDLARASHSGMVGRLRLGVIPTIAPYLLPTIIGNLSAAHGDLDVFVRETMTPKLVQELLDGRLDAAIVALPIGEPSLIEEELFSENFVLIRPSADAEKSVPNGEELRRMRLLLLEEGHCFRDQTLAFCNIQSSLPRDGLDGSSLSTLVQIVDAGMGVTLIPDMAVPIETRAASVSIVRFADPQPSRSIGMIWRKTNPLGKQLMQIADIVRQSGAQIRDGAGRSST